MASGTGIIDFEGKVYAGTDASPGAVVPGVSVTLLRNGTAVGTATTDANGWYEVEVAESAATGTFTASYRQNGVVVGTGTYDGGLLVKAAGEDDAYWHTEYLQGTANRPAGAQTTLGVPAGFTSDQLKFRDTFGTNYAQENTPTGQVYDFRDNWNFGFSSCNTAPDEWIPGCHVDPAKKDLGYAGWYDSNPALHGGPDDPFLFDLASSSGKVRECADASQVFQGTAPIKNRFNSTDGSIRLTGRGLTLRASYAGPGGTGCHVWDDPDTAVNERTEPLDYLDWKSASINTWGKQTFGPTLDERGAGTGITPEEWVVQVRAKLPQRTNLGSVAAIWLLPAHNSSLVNDEVLRGAAESSDNPTYEIDVLETGAASCGEGRMVRGWADGDGDGRMDRVFQPTTGDNDCYYPDARSVTSHNLHRGGVIQDQVGHQVDLAAGYHVFSARVNSATGLVIYYVDGQEVNRITGASDSSYFLLLNQHIAGPGAEWWTQAGGDTTTRDYVIDEVQVYERVLPKPGFLWKEAFTYENAFRPWWGGGAAKDVSVVETSTGNAVLRVTSTTTGSTTTTAKPLLDYSTAGVTYTLTAQIRQASGAVGATRDVRLRLVEVDRNGNVVKNGSMGTVTFDGTAAWRTASASLVASGAGHTIRVEVLDFDPDGNVANRAYELDNVEVTSSWAK